jgi:hypothetical protein
MRPVWPRREAPSLSSPDRQVGGKKIPKDFEIERTDINPGPSDLIVMDDANPELTLGAIQCRPFGSGRCDMLTTWGADTKNGVSYASVTVYLPD